MDYATFKISIEVDVEDQKLGTLKIKISAPSGRSTTLKLIVEDDRTGISFEGPGELFNFLRVTKGTLKSVIKAVDLAQEAHSKREANDERVLDLTSVIEKLRANNLVTFDKENDSMSGLFSIKNDGHLLTVEELELWLHMLHKGSAKCDQMCHDLHSWNIDMLPSSELKEGH